MNDGQKQNETTKKKACIIWAYNPPNPAIRDHLLADPLYHEVIESSAFQRLFGVPFLGGLAYPEELGVTNSRGDHSIGVAALALYYSYLLNLPKIKERRLVLSALLHDLDHFPFSHTMDHAFRARSRVCHRDNILRILRLTKTARKRTLIDLFELNAIPIRSLPAFFSRSHRPMIFRSTHNVDTLDGILRAL